MTTPTEDPPAYGRCEYGRCPDCKGAIHWHPGLDGQPIAIQPGNYPTAPLPPGIYRHLSRGLVYLGEDPREYGTVRIEHTEICPARPRPVHPVLADMWTRLAIRYQRTRSNT